MQQNDGKQTEQLSLRDALANLDFDDLDSHAKSNAIKITLRAAGVNPSYTYKEIETNLENRQNKDGSILDVLDDSQLKAQMSDLKRQLSDKDFEAVKDALIKAVPEIEQVVNFNDLKRSSKDVVPADRIMGSENKSDKQESKSNFFDKVKAAFSQIGEAFEAVKEKIASTFSKKPKVNEVEMDQITKRHTAPDLTRDTQDLGSSWQSAQPTQPTQPTTVQPIATVLSNNEFNIKLRKTASSFNLSHTPQDEAQSIAVSNSQRQQGTMFKS